MGLSVDDRFPLSFYYRIANQIIKQAKVYRAEGNMEDLYITLNRYSRLMSEIIPQHRSYLIYSSKEKLHHKKILQEFAKEIEKLKPLFARKDSKVSRESSRRSKHSEDDSQLTSQRWNEKDQAFVCCSGGKDLIAARDHDINVHAVRQYFPSPVLSYIEELPIVGQVSHIPYPEPRNEHFESSREESSTCNAIQDVHISGRLMEEFMELARTNTNQDLETCGILGAFFKNRTFYVTTLIVPKQESTSNSCQTLNEEEIYAIQDEQSLFPVGWIHTHPSQTCFLSSIDLHTQYSYQVMLPEAVAIVMAPTDATRSYGIFRISDPGGTDVLKHCQENGFHSHPETADGSSMYESCSNVYVNPNLRFEIIDLRSSSP